MPRLKLDIVTAERVVYSGEADVVVAPGSEGELAILPRHTPLLTTLQPGALRIKAGDEEIDLAVSGGFLEAQPDRVVVLADTAERAEEIDVSRAAAAAERAERLLTQRTAAPQGDLERAVASLRRSQVRLKVARRQRPGPGQIQR